MAIVNLISKTPLFAKQLGNDASEFGLVHLRYGESKVSSPSRAYPIIHLCQPMSSSGSQIALSYDSTGPPLRPATIHQSFLDPGTVRAQLVARLSSAGAGALQNMLSKHFGTRFGLITRMCARRLVVIPVRRRCARRAAPPLTAPGAPKRTQA
jgi:hypothetical protein